MTRKTDSITDITFGFNNNVSNWGDLVNQNFQILAYQGTHVTIKNTAVNTPPATPTERDTYIVGDNPTGAWATGYDEHSLAIYGYDKTGTTLGWFNVEPYQGFTALDATNKRLITYIDSTSNWISTGLSASQISSIGNILTIEQIISGINATTGDDRVDYSAIKNTPTPLTADQINTINNAIIACTTDSTITGDGKNTPLAVANPFTDADETKLDALSTDRQLPTGGNTDDVLTRTATGNAWQPPQTSGNTFAGVATDDTLTGTGVDAARQLSVANPFTDDDESKLDAIEPNATADQTTREIADKLNNPADDNEKIDYDNLKNKPDPSTSTAVTPNQRVDEINKATNQITASRVSGLPDGTVNTDNSIDGDGSDSLPLKLPDATKTRIAKLSTTQPNFTPENYQADLTPGIPSTSYNYVKGIEAFKRSLMLSAGGGITSVISNPDQFSGTGVDLANRLTLRYPFTQDEKNKLANIEPLATADQTTREIVTGINDPSNTVDEQIDYNRLKNKPTTLSADTPNHRIEEINKATNQINAARISGLPTALTETPITIRNKLETLVGNSKFDGDYVLGLLKEPAIVELIVAVAGTRVDDIIQTIANLVLDHNTVTGDTINFNDQTDILKSVNNVEAFATDKYSLLEVSDGTNDYDAIIIDNNFILAKTAKTPPVEFRYVNDSTRGFDDTYSQEFMLLRDGAPVRVTGSDDNDPQYHTIRVGRSRNNSPLVAKIYPETALTLTIKIATLRTHPTTSGVTTLGALTDVDTTGVVDNNVLTYDDTDDTWKPKSSTSATVPENRKIPDGGSSGQVLTKSSSSDYAVDWETPSTTPTNQRIPRGGNTNQVITKTGSANYATAWRDVPKELPAGGTTGQILKKKTNTDGDVEWDNEEGGVALDQIEDFAEVNKTARLPDNKLPVEVQDFFQAVSGMEGWQDEDNVSTAAGVSTATGSNATTLTQAKALTYRNYYLNPAGFLSENFYLIVRIPVEINDQQFRLAEEDPVGSRDPDDLYGDIYYKLGTGGVDNWVLINAAPDNGYHYYRAHITRVRGDGRLYVQKYDKIIIDTDKIDTGHANRYVDELLDSVRGYSIAQANRSSQQRLNTFTTALTLTSTMHGVMLVSLQANVTSSSTSQFQLGDVTTATTQVYISLLREGEYYDGSVSRRGNGQLVGTFIVNNTSGVKQGTIRCYIARNAANQTGTYATYTPETGASGALAGQIAIRWEVTLLRTDSSAGGAGGGITQSQAEEFARDAVSAAIVAGNGDVTAVNHDQQNQIILSIKAGSISVTDIQRDPTDNTKALNLSTWKTLFDIGASSGGSTANAITKQSDASSATIATSATHTLRTITLNAPQLLYKELKDFDLYEQITMRISASAVATPIKLQAVKGATGTEVIDETRGFSIPTTATDYDMVLKLGSDDNSYRIQVVNLSTANTLTLASNSNITYPRIKYIDGAEVENPPRLEAPVMLHMYDGAESFRRPSVVSSFTKLAFNRQKNILSLLDNDRKHYAVNPDTGARQSSSWEFTVPALTSNHAIRCASWDTTGRYLYILASRYANSANQFTLIVMDVGTGATPSFTRITSKEFAIASSSSHFIGGISIDATHVRFLFVSSNDNDYIDTYTIAGTKVSAQSNVTVPSGFTYGSGLIVLNNFTECYISVGSAPYLVAKYNVTHTLTGASMTLVKRESFPVHGTSNNITYKSIRDQIFVARDGASSTQNHIEVYDKAVDTSLPRVWRYNEAWKFTFRKNYGQTIIKNPNNNKLYVLYSGASSGWRRNNNLTDIDVLTSLENPTVETSSPSLGSSIRTSAPLPSGFLKDNKLYCPIGRSTNLMVAIDLSDFSVSSSLTTLTGMTGAGPLAYHIQMIYGDTVNFWVVKQNKAYAFDTSTFARVTTKDINLPGTGWQGHSSSASDTATNFITGNANYLYAAIRNSSQTRYDFHAYNKSTGAADTTADFSLSDFIYNWQYNYRSSANNLYMDGDVVGWLYNNQNNFYGYSRVI